MNNKIYARQITPEYQESPLMMFDEYPDGVIIAGNRQYKGHTTPEYDALDTEYEGPETIVVMLSEATGVPYDYTTIRGCCQGDWQYLYYPAGQYNNDALCAIETEYFNTGTEWIVHDEDEAPESPDDINGYSMYCYSYSPAEEIAREGDVDVADVVLYEFDGYTKTAQYKEVKTA